MDKVFDIWHTTILDPWEGGLANRPPKEDPGGLTNRGVTLAIWKQYAPKLFSIPGTEATLRSITPQQAKTIAYEVYWKFYAIDTVKNAAIKLLLADSVWGGGGYSSLGYKSGTNTQRATQINTENAKNPKLFDALVQRRLAYLRSLSNYAANKNGWENRVINGDKTRLSITQVVKKYKLDTIGAIAGISLLGFTLLFLGGRAIYKKYKKSSHAA